MVTPAPLVSVLIVTFNSARHIQACLASVAAQEHREIEIIVVDNNSEDDTRRLLAGQAGTKLIVNEQNRGFAAAQNQAMRAARGEWMLCLNPDVVLAQDFLRQLLAVETDARVGTLCGKLLRWHPGAQPERSNTIDSTGIYFTRNLRHLDRGAEQEDRGQFDQMEYVFGATGAAALYRRALIEEASIGGEFFDERFFSYREDADLAWRAQLMGWKCLYVPAAVGWHERRVTPERRGQLPREINWHSVKNRFLMRANNSGFGLHWRTHAPTTARDMMIIGYALLRDWRLFAAIFYPLTHLREALSRRRQIQQKRRVADRELARWFRNTPTAEPCKTSAPPA